MVRIMDKPIACALTADAFRARAAELAALAARALDARAPIPGGERLTFAGDPRTASDPHAAVAAERACCAFLDLDLRRQGDRLVLEVTGPDEVRPLMRSCSRTTA